MSFIKYIMDGVHFKLIIIDSTIAYVGSANLTGAGMGMKSPKKRNFEAGILTDDPEMLCLKQPSNSSTMYGLASFSQAQA